MKEQYPSQFREKELAYEREVIAAHSRMLKDMKVDHYSHQDKLDIIYAFRLDFQPASC